MTTINDLRAIIDNKRTPILIYRELVASPGLFIHCLEKIGQMVILMRNTETTGHWVAIKYRPDWNAVMYFSSFGTKPDHDKLKFIDPRVNESLKQKANVINDQLKGWACNGRRVQVHYSEFQFQDPFDPSDQSCGYWCALFLNFDGDYYQLKNFVDVIHTYTGKSFKQIIYDYGTTGRLTPPRGIID